MRNAQGLPVNMIVLTALALLVLVVVGAFFISGFGEASGSVNVVDADQADCQSLCQSMAASAFNYAECTNTCEGTPATCSATGEDCTTDADCTGGYKETTQGEEYATTCTPNFGACTVTLRGGAQCQI